MSKPLLTVAIPAYNVELFIEETILSIANSKYVKDIEILVVNDGSTDKTAEMANAVAAKYPSVKVIDKPNGGHGSSINAAIKNATGKYFRLLDGDDWFNTAELNDYIEHLKTEDADIVFTDLVECFLKTGLNRPVTYYSNLKEYQKINLDDAEFAEWGPMLPTTTIKTELLKNFNLKIDEKCFYVDQEYNLACFLSAKTAVYYPFMIYQYRLEREGQSMEKSSLIRNVKSHETVCKRLLKEYHKHVSTLSEKRKTYLKNRVLIPMCHMQYFIAIEWCKSRKHFLSFDNELKKYPEFYNNPGIAGTLTKFHRKTKGLFVKLDTPIRKIADWKNRRAAIANEKTERTSLKHRLIVLIGCLAVIAIANIVVINFVNSEKTVYYWDLSAYWQNSVTLTDAYKSSFAEGTKLVIDSLNTDYNLLPLVPMLPFLLIFGTSRLAYVLIILNLFILPFALIMLRTVTRCFKNIKKRLNCLSKPLIFSVFMLSPTVLIPVLNGRPDAICLVVIALIFYLLAKSRLHYISNYFTLGILTLILIVLRRYFCLFALCLYVTIFIVKSIIAINEYGATKTAISKIIKIILKLCASGMLILGLMALFFRPLLTRYLTGGYNDAYSAYLEGDFLNQINLFIQYYGILFLGLILIGIIIAYLKYKKSAISELTSIGIISSLLTFILFTRIQTLSDQHMYIFIPFFTFAISILVAHFSLKKKTILISILSSGIILLLNIFTFTGVRATTCSATCYITGVSETFRPLIRTDIDSIKSLSDYLEETLKPTDYLYVLSSSFTFNSNTLANLYLPEPVKYNLSGVKDVDKRDGFPDYFFNANYVLVADPVQTHLEDGQEVITYLANQILTGQVANLQLIKTYPIDQNITLKLYKKQGPYNSNFLLKTKTYFKEKYPNYPILYESIPTSNL